MSVDILMVFMHTATPPDPRLNSPDHHYFELGAGTEQSDLPGAWGKFHQFALVSFRAA